MLFNLDEASVQDSRETEMSLVHGRQFYSVKLRASCSGDVRVHACVLYNSSVGTHSVCCNNNCTVGISILASYVI